MDKEVIKLIAESPEALEAFNSWMNLQWAEFIGGGLLLTGVVIAVGFFVYWAIKNS